MSHGLQTGDRVVCIDDLCRDPVKAGRLSEGETYTVGHVPKDGWSIYLREMPALQFNAARFVKAPAIAG